MILGTILGTILCKCFVGLYFFRKASWQYPLLNSWLTCSLASKISWVMILGKFLGRIHGKYPARLDLPGNNPCNSSWSRVLGKDPVGLALSCKAPWQRFIWTSSQESLHDKFHSIILAKYPVRLDLSDKALALSLAQSLVIVRSDLLEFGLGS